MMRTATGATTPCCHTFLAFILKFLNFLQTFVGLAMIVYSVYMLSQWNHTPYPLPPPLAPSPAFPGVLPSGLETFSTSHMNFVADVSVSGLDHPLSLNFQSLPAPWFIYAFMAVGILLCCITCIGHIAAEAINGCCLCFFALFTTLLIIVEAALMAFIAIDKKWERDLPFDPTGQLDSLRTFIEGNANVCKWVGITLVIIQALSIFLAIILRAMVSTRRLDDDVEGDYEVRGREREPFLNSHLNQPSGYIKGDGRAAHSEIWSSRIREKYGFSGGDAKLSVDQNA